MATSLDLFAYLAAFVTVVLALAISDLVQSVHRLIGARDRVQWSLTALIAAATVFLAILEEFFGLWRLVGIERFTYLDLLILILPPILLSLAAMAVLPDEVPAGNFDLADYYMANRRLVWLLLGLWVLAIFVRLADMLQLATGRAVTLREAASLLPWQTVPLLFLLLLLGWSRDMRVQLAGAVAILLLVNSAMVDRDIRVTSDQETVPL